MRTNPPTKLAWLLSLVCVAGLSAQGSSQGTSSKSSTGSAKSAKSANSAKSAKGSAVTGSIPPGMSPGSLSALFGPPKAGAEGELQTLTKYFMGRMRANFMAMRAKAEKDGRGLPSISLRPPSKVVEEVAPRFMATAKKYAGKDDAFLFLGWCLLADQSPSNKTTRAAMEAVFAEPLSGPKCAATLSRLARIQPVLGADFPATMARLEKLAKTDLVKAAVLFARAESNSGAKDPAIAKSAITDYRMALRLAPKASFAGSARGALNGMTLLQVGMPAPETEGKDLDGVAFKLSDYRGKAVMLSFWGDW